MGGARMKGGKEKLCMESRLGQARRNCVWSHDSDTTAAGVRPAAHPFPLNIEQPRIGRALIEQARIGRLHCLRRAGARRTPGRKQGTGCACKRVCVCARARE